MVKDEELINLVAKLWIENGGDAIGFSWCHEKIKLKILELEEYENDEV